MGRKTKINDYIGKVCEGVQILERISPSIKGRVQVSCRCLNCNGIFQAGFANVKKGSNKSCGCLQYGFTKFSSRWKGHGDISSSVFYSIKQGAEQRNLSFNISIEEIWQLFQKQNGKCALSGVQLYFPPSRFKSGTASLDRIDSKIGYEPSNIQWVHVDVNYMKQDMNNEEFLSWISIIYKHNE